MTAKQENKEKEKGGTSRNPNIVGNQNTPLHKAMDLYLKEKSRDHVTSFEAILNSNKADIYKFYKGKTIINKFAAKFDDLSIHDREMATKLYAAECEVMRSRGCNELLLENEKIEAYRKVGKYSLMAEGVYGFPLEKVKREELLRSNSLKGPHPLRIEANTHQIKEKVPSAEGLDMDKLYKILEGQQKNLAKGCMLFLSFIVIILLIIPLLVESFMKLLNWLI